ncbi:CvpA family protein [Treponema pedis]|nr:CvpA family protein [Treponema pedis]
MIKVTIRGFIAEFFSKAAVIVGGLVAVLFYKLFTPIISGLMGPQALSAVIAFLILFLATYLVIKLIELLLGSLFSNQSLKSLDRALGFFLGLIEGLLLIAVLLMLIHLQPVVNPAKLLDGSIFAKILSPFIFNWNSVF